MNWSVDNSSNQNNYGKQILHVLLPAMLNTYEQSENYFPMRLKKLSDFLRRPVSGPPVLCKLFPRDIRSSPLIATRSLPVLTVAIQFSCAETFETTYVSAHSFNCCLFESNLVYIRIILIPSIVDWLLLLCHPFTNGRTSDALWLHHCRF